MTPEASPAPRSPWVVAGCAALVGGAFYAIGTWILGRAHPHEEVYILYRYADHVAQGHGIVYNAGGPPAEGATDFLWLMAVSGLHAAGIDLARASLLLNALGAALASALVVHCARSAVLCGVPVIASLLVGSTALAAYVGFSAMLYSALAGLCFVVQLARDPRRLRGLPLLGLTLGLIRPDGVLLGLGFTLLGALRLWHSKRSNEWAAYAGAALVAGLLGAAYFAWRVWYFGEWLPLPLYVKGHPNVAPSSLAFLPDALRGVAARVQGIGPSVGWLTSGQGPAPLLAVLAALSAWLWRSDRSAVRRVWIALLPAGLLLLALSLSWQSQNIRFRFQAPALMLVTLASVVLAAGAARRSARAGRLWALGLCAALLPTLYFGVAELVRIGRGERREYLESFAPELGAWLAPDDQVVLTEAGRVGFYTSARVYDLGGLNEPETARVPPSLERVRELDPDLVMYHHDGVLDLAGVLGDARVRHEQVLSLTREQLARAVRPAQRDLFERPPGDYADSAGRSRLIAPAVATRFLVENDGYALFAVDYRDRDRFEHVYGFRRGHFDLARVEEALRAACANDPYVAYTETRHPSGPPQRETPRRP